METKQEYRRVYFPRGRGKLALLTGYLITGNGQQQAPLQTFFKETAHLLTEF